jgi:hypothetical protein
VVGRTFPVPSSSIVANLQLAYFGARYDYYDNEQRR